MLILNAGLVKSGSTYLHLMVKNYVANFGYIGRKKLATYDKDYLEFNKNLSIKNKTLPLFFRALEKGYLTCFKTHLALPDTADIYLNNRQLSCTFIYRNPRDIVMSILRDAHADRVIMNRKTQNEVISEEVQSSARGYAWLESAEEAASHVINMKPVFDSYQNMPNTQCIRYEELVQSPYAVMECILTNFGFEINPELLKQTIDTYDPSKTSLKRLADSKHRNTLEPFLEGFALSTEDQLYVDDEMEQDLAPLK